MFEEHVTVTNSKKGLLSCSDYVVAKEQQKVKDQTSAGNLFKKVFEIGLGTCSSSLPGV